MFFQVFASSVEPVIGDLVTRSFSGFLDSDWPAAWHQMSQLLSRWYSRPSSNLPVHV